MSCLFIGQGDLGSTSNGRFEAISRIDRVHDWILYDVSPSWHRRYRLANWLKWRFKSGPLVALINFELIVLAQRRFHCVVVDKGVWIWPTTLKLFKKRGATLIHWTPDPAFAFHRSRQFYRGLNHYHHVYTTKKYELLDYKRIFNGQLYLVNQSIERSLTEFIRWENRPWDFGFLGHYEENREGVITGLIEQGFTVSLGGRGWNQFAMKMKSHSNFKYHGESGFFGKEYQEFWGNCRIGLGLLSKIVPDTITTRTFEIPAYNSVLCSPSTPEILAFFGSDSFLDMDTIHKNASICAHPDKLSELLHKQQMALQNQGVFHDEAMAMVLENLNAQ